MELEPVASTAIESIGYDEEAEEITVVYKGGYEVNYPGDLAAFEELQKAPSVGKVVNGLKAAK